jgi:gamma-tubulin complex component 3
LVRPAFVGGKGINFIRTCLHQVGWTLQLEETEEGGELKSGAKKNDRESDESTKHGATGDSQQAIMERLGYHFVAEPMGMHLNPRLTRTLQRAEEIVHSHILQSLRQDHNLTDHLFALKQFLFHGQGDFFSSLLESLYNEFGCGTRTRQNVNTSFVTGHTVAGVYPQQLLAMMEAALRTTNAKDLPSFCLERLRVEMLPLELEEPTAAGHGLFTTPLRNLVDAEPEQDNASMSQPAMEDTRTVWDIFMLDYIVPDPLVAIVHEKALEQYKLVYSFLFGLRKVEYMLNSTWRQSATLQHALQVMAQNNGLQVATSVGYAHATVLLRKIAMTRQAMTHFCVNLKSYCMLEVLEGGWKQLQTRLEHARTLDEAIQAHDHYLEGICRKCLLVKGRKHKRRQHPNMEERPRSNKFAQLFRVILSIATEFCTLQERLFDDALEAAERVAQRRREAEQRMTHGQWGFENEQDLAEEESFFGLADAKELEEVVRLAEAFHQCMQTLLEALDGKVNGRSKNMSTTSIHDDDDEMEGEQIEELQALIEADYEVRRVYACCDRLYGLLTN